MFHPDISQIPEAIPADSLPGIPLDCLLRLFSVTDILMDSDNITIDKLGEFTPQNPRITLRFNANEEGENLEGSLYLENKEVGDIEPGEEIAIYKP